MAWSASAFGSFEHVLLQYLPRLSHDNGVMFFSFLCLNCRYLNCRYEWAREWYIVQFLCHTMLVLEGVVGLGVVLVPISGFGGVGLRLLLWFHNWLRSMHYDNMSLTSF